MKEFKGRVAVVTGGASGIGRALAGAFAGEGMKVVIADVEQRALDATAGELRARGAQVLAVATDVSKREAVQALADRVFAEHGACHILCNNAGVGAPSAPVWETTPNDWAWIYGVNVMGVVHGIHAFVPRMLASGEEGLVINTSSGDGGIEPLPDQAVYASSKAAVSIITECLGAQLAAASDVMRAMVFYPSGGLLDTGIWSCDRNRPKELAREIPVAGEPQTLEKFRAMAKKAGMDLPVQDLDELAQHLLGDIRAGRFVSMIGCEHAGQTLEQRAKRIGAGELPQAPSRGMMI
jgi:NAD(P)-dependent dehydrogenase (short-subunit alcohol dehydrogenase family)